MKKDKGYDKDKYRRRPYTPLLNRDLERNLTERLNELVEECIKKKISKKSASIFLDEYFKNDPNLEVFLSATEALKESFVELDSCGANLEIIRPALSPNSPESFRKDPLVALRIYDPEFTPLWDQIKKEYEEKRANLTKLGKEKRVIKNSLERILSLKTIPNNIDVNTKLIKAQDAIKEFKKVIDLYFKARIEGNELIGFSQEWGIPSGVVKMMQGKYKPISPRSHHFWEKRVVLLVDELKRIGFSDKSAYTKTANLLNLAFPHTYKDTDPDLIRQRYTYHKKKK